MSYIIFCKGKRADKPFIVEDLKLRLYSMEELCYYVYSNVSLCDKELLQEQLATWIEAQCGLPDLAESLRIVLMKDPRPERIAAQIFAYTDYLNKQERDAVCERIRKYTQLGYNERRKMRGDYFYLDGKYKEAIKDYEDMLEQKAYDDQKMKHHLLYNIGCCYAAMFYYDIAYGWFLRAAQMDIAKGEDVLAALYVKKMSLSDKEWETFLEEHAEMATLAPAMEKQMQEIKKQWAEAPEAKEIENLRTHKQGRDKEYYEKIDRLLETWKAKA
ncbi:MAG: hypothetical protein J6K37_07045 [Lachnospiraceae bacterium]|nr:hypothetical protein [Lachnospiraceae bacterium]